MVAGRVVCPQCGVELAMPPGCIGRAVRCAICQTSFRPPEARASAMEDVVASWLEEGDGAEDGAAAAAAPKSHALPHRRQETGPPGAQISRGDIRIVTLATYGVLTEFPAARLEDPVFRCAMPRQCLQCGMRTHLRVHVIIYAAHLVDSISLEAEHSAGTLELSNAEIRGMTGQQVLDRLPHVPNVPPPGDLPMPYWLCDMCSGSGVVSGQIQVNPVSGSGFCRLQIRNIHRALEFLRSAGGEGTADFEKLRELVERSGEKPWDLLPEVVQHRVQQWFQPQDDEQFLAYVPDRDYVRTEDGMAGLVISTRRLLSHSPLRHRESPISQPLELAHAFSLTDRKETISIRTPAWTHKRMTVNREGLIRLRRALALAKFQAVWA